MKFKSTNEKNLKRKRFDKVIFLMVHENYINNKISMKHNIKK